MSAPTADLDVLRGLLPDWDSYGAVRISEDALRIAESVAFVPLCDGGIQVELHGGGWEIEIEIGPDGRVVGVHAETTPMASTERCEGLTD